MSSLFPPVTDSLQLPAVSTGDEERVSELECIVEELRGKLEEKEGEIDDKERELVEAKDRITALENQMVEYASIMNDQSKVCSSIHCTCARTCTCTCIK